MPMPSFLQQEQRALFYWIPVCIACGILTYFLWPGVSLWLAITVLITMGYSWYRLQGRGGWSLVLAVMFWMALGYSAIAIRTLWLDSPVLDKKLVTQLTATIEHATYLPGQGRRLLLKDIVFEEADASIPVPTHIRLVVRTGFKGSFDTYKYKYKPRGGERISTLAVLLPPPKPVIPGGYDFSFQAYYQQIGAIGYAISDVTIVEAFAGWSIELLRESVMSRIIAILKPPESGIASALLIGDRTHISDNWLDTIRKSGLAHLLAISGMHVSLVAGLFFFITRAGCACSVYLTLHYPIKKWAAVVAIMAATGYVFLAGLPISAQRACMMAVLVLLAVILDRIIVPMRCIAWAAIIVLLFQPESLLTPSFQMSFAAATALVAAYSWLTQKSAYEERGIIKRCGVAIWHIMFSSIIAGLATAPFALFHFNQATSYGMIANMLAIPLTMLWIMPWGMLGVCLMPFGLEATGLIPMSWGIHSLLQLAEYTAHLPNAHHLSPSFSPYMLVVISLGFLWLALWQSKWRVLGVVCIGLGIVGAVMERQPDILIDRQGSIFAIRNQEGELVFSPGHKPWRFVESRWLQRMGKEVSADTQTYHCDDLACIAHVRGRLVSFVHDPLALPTDCQQVDILVNLTFTYFPCTSPELVIGRFDLYRNGAMALWLGEEIEVVASER